MLLSCCYGRIHLWCSKHRSEKKEEEDDEDDENEPGGSDPMLKLGSALKLTSQNH